MEWDKLAALLGAYTLGLIVGGMLVLQTFQPTFQESPCAKKARLAAENREKVSD
jgi:hypothetical protein